MPRWVALGEVILCSGFPTQIFLLVVLGGSGVTMLDPDGRLSLGFILTLSLADAALLGGIIFSLLWIHGEPAQPLFLGVRPIRREAALGLLLIPITVAIVLAGFALIRTIAPWLHNVPENPLEALIQTPRDAAVFALVAIVAGGLREEIQRAFILDRFDRHLGGAVLGLVLYSIAFGIGHTIQGWDAAVMTGLLGAIWGTVFILRRSIVAPVVCHAGFNVAEILRYVSGG